MFAVERSALHTAGQAVVGGEQGIVYPAQCLFHSFECCAIVRYFRVAALFIML